MKQYNTAFTIQLTYYKKQNKASRDGVSKGSGLGVEWETSEMIEICL